MTGKLHSVVLDVADIKTVSDFYGDLLGLSGRRDDGDWISFALPGGGGTRLAFQSAPDHVVPRWPDQAHPQQMHLDVRVPDHAAGVARAVELGATRLGGGGEAWTVLADPGGHPFCVCQGDPGGEAVLADVAIDCPSGSALAPFYAELLGMEVTWEGDVGAMVTADGRLPVMFQNVAGYVPPSWPDAAHPQQFHLDVEVGHLDVDAVQARLLSLGATRLPAGGEEFRVFADPVGHPFCLVWDNPVVSG